MKTVGVAVAVASLFVAANAIADGATLYAEKGCAPCHGASGDSPILPTYPKLTGQNPEYCTDQITLIGNGARSSGMSAAMMDVARQVNREEAAEICAYLAEVQHNAE